MTKEIILNSINTNSINMKKLSVLIAVLFVSYVVNAQQNIEVHRLLDIQVRGDYNNWSWETLHPDNGMIVTLFMNSSGRIETSIDLIKISNKEESKFRLPYRGTVDINNAAHYVAFDKDDIKVGVELRKQSFYFDLIVKYSNLQVIYQFESAKLYAY